MDRHAESGPACYPLTMKQPRVRFDLRTARVAILLLVVGIVAAASGSAEVVATDVSRLMAASGVAAQMQAVPEIVLDQVESSAAFGRLSQFDRRRLREAVLASHRADRLVESVQRSLERDLDAHEVDTVLGWLESPLGRRITALEVAVTTVEAARGGFRGGAALQPSMSQERRALLNRFSQAVRGLEFGVEHGMAYASTVLRTLTLLVDQKALSAERARRFLEGQRPQIKARAREMLANQFALTYQDLSDAQLAEYVEFAETPAAKRYQEAVGKAVGESLVQAGEELFRLLQR